MSWLSSAAAAAAVSYQENVLFVSLVPTERVAVVIHDCPTTIIVKNHRPSVFAFHNRCLASILSRARHHRLSTIRRSLARPVGRGNHYYAYTHCARLLRGLTRRTPDSGASVCCCCSRSPFRFFSASIARFGFPSTADDPLTIPTGRCSVPRSGALVRARTRPLVNQLPSG